MKHKAQGIEERIARLPGQAAPDEPHWIVVNLARYRDAPKERRVGLYYRHPTHKAAEAEAHRLAEKFPGRKFGVYASGPSYEVPAEAIAA